mgnify:CR=1 FL=1
MGWTPDVLEALADAFLHVVERRGLPGPAILALQDDPARAGPDEAGVLPGLEREKLRRVIDQGHRQGRMMRFWGVPDEAFAWRELRDAGVDWIGTDKVAQLAAFLRMP